MGPGAASPDRDNRKSHPLLSIRKNLVEVYKQLGAIYYYLMTQNHDKGLAGLARLSLTRADRAVISPKNPAQAMVPALEPPRAINRAGMVLDIAGAE